jgi:peptidoglycan-associated lipoprotein
MRNMKSLAMVALSVMLVAGIAGCGKKKPVTPVPNPEEEAARERARLDAEMKAIAARAKARADSIAAAEAARVKAAETMAPLSLTDVYFDYDKSNLTSVAESTLGQDAAGLSKHAGASVVIEGHCDERGTNEYNLALGERRAAAAKSFLVNYGIEAGRLQTVSYGEERPVDPGHDEAAWAKNRRAHFDVKE